MIRFELDKEIQELLPPHSPEESERLRAAIALDGHIDPLVVAKIGKTKILVDGYHRLAICRKEDLAYDTREITLSSHAAAIEWVIGNQLARRNLSPEQRSYYIGKEYLYAKKQRGGDQKSQEAKSQNETSIPADEAVAAKHDVSAATVNRDAAFAEAVDKIGDESPEAKAEILSGKSELTKAEIAATGGILCKRCQRDGPAKDCRGCAARQERSGVKKPRKPKPKKAPKPAPVVKVKPIPKDESAKDAMKRINFSIDEWCKKLAELAHDIPRDHWLDELHRREKAVKLCKEAIEELKGGKCSCVCPTCKGAKENEGKACRDCHAIGRLPKSNADRLK